MMSLWSSIQIVVLKAWVLGLMNQIQPVAPWVDTYDASAEAIATEAVMHPLFENDDGRKSASVLLSLAKFEGALRPDAKGDCDKTDTKTGMCVKGSRPHSFCMFQLNESNFQRLGVTKDAVLSDVNICTATAMRMVHESFQICRGVPLEDRLNSYAGGRGGCVQNIKGRHRMNYALWLWKSGPALDYQNVWADTVREVAFANE